MSNVREVTQLVRDVVSGVSVVDVVPESIPSSLVEKRTAVVYPIPGNSTPSTHTARSGKPSIAFEGTVVVEYHVMVPMTGEDIGSVVEGALADAVSFVDELLPAIWRSAIDKSRLGSQVSLLRTVAVTQFGEMGWADVATIGARIEADYTSIIDIG